MAVVGGGGVSVPCATAASGVVRTITKANKTLLQRNMACLHWDPSHRQTRLEIGDLIKIKGPTMNQPVASCVSGRHLNVLRNRRNRCETTSRGGP